MKSLLKVICRYMGTAVLIILLIIIINVGVFLYLGYHTLTDSKEAPDTNIREHLKMINQEMKHSESEYLLTDKGYELLEHTNYEWAMLINGQGQVAWEWKVPEEIPRSYTMADVSVISKWYIKDYPIRTWTYEDGLMVFASKKEATVRFNFEQSLAFFDHLPQNIIFLISANLILTALTVIFLGYRFYRSLSPVITGIENLSKGKSVKISEKGVANDIARAFNRTSEILDEKNKKLAQRDLTRTNWIAGVSHDIRTPLSLIAGYSDSLSHDLNLTGEQKKKVLSIQKQSMTIKRLIEDLNLTSKLEYDAHPLRLNTYSPSSLIREIVTEYYNNGLEDRYEICLSIQQDVESTLCHGDIELMKRCLRNLIGNSLRHNENGCILHIRVNLQAEMVEYCFSDTGPGIPKDVIQILESQSPESVKGPHVMGLQVVRQIILAHHGRIAYQKRPSGNYDITLYCP